MSEPSINPSLEVASALRMLRTTPTKGLWIRELTEIVTGSREQELEITGSPRQYVSRLLTDSIPGNTAERAFNAALLNLVSYWHPEQQQSYYNARMLQLIASFTPPNAFQRVLGSLALWGAIGPLADVSNTLPYKIYDLALSALEAYFTTAPADAREPGFKTYCDFLWRESETEEHLPHAFRRLIELRVLDPANEDRRNLIRGMLASNGALEEFLRYAIGIHFGLLRVALRPVLIHCIEFRDARRPSAPYWLFHELSNLLRNFGASISQDRAGMPDFLVLPDGERIPILLPPSAKIHYRQILDHESQTLFDRNVTLIFSR